MIGNARLERPCACDRNREPIRAMQLDGANNHRFAYSPITLLISLLQTYPETSTAFPCLTKNPLRQPCPPMS
jgi:hypothetical protein